MVTACAGGLQARAERHRGWKGDGPWDTAVTLHRRSACLAVQAEDARSSAWAVVSAAARPAQPIDRMVPFDCWSGFLPPAIRL